MQTIDYYILKVDGNPPMLVKNTSATLFTEQLGSNHTISVRAVDKCGQKGEEAQEAWIVSTTSHTTTANPTPFISVLVSVAVFTVVLGAVVGMVVGILVRYYENQK